MITINPIISDDCPDIIKEFLGYIQTIKGKSEKTVLEYYFDLRTFFRFMKTSKNLADQNTKLEEIDISDIDIKFIETITLTNIYEFLSYTATQRGNGPAARARKVSSLRTFFNFLTNKVGKLKNNPTIELETPKIKSSLPKFLSLEESMELLRHVDGKYKERDYCMLTLFLNCGMRLSELVGLNVSDVRNDNTLRLLGKGNKERIIYLNEACQDAIQKYLAVRPVDGVVDKNALFLSRLKRRISPKTVQHIVYKTINETGLSGRGYSVHKLRHTAATLMYQHGNVDIRVLKDILGHENLGTTEIYTHVSNSQMQEAINANPLSHVKPKFD